MTKSLRNRWVKALRSGKYKQGQGELRDIDNQFCCLGVLADVCSVTWKRLRPNEMWHHCGFTRRECWGTELPSDHSQFGLSRPQLLALMRLNDEQGWTFKRIANWIEKHVDVTV